MSERRALDPLERSLVELGHAIELPDEPRLRARVLSEISERGARGPAPWWRAGGARRALALAAIVLLAGAAALVVSPATRRAVADLLGIGGVDVRYSDDEPAGIAVDLDLGDETSLEGAKAEVGFEVAVPAALGAPDRVFVNDDVAGGSVSLVCRPGDGLPRTRTTGAGALLTEFRGSVDGDYVKKLLNSGVRIRVTSVSGAEAYWIEGDHTLIVRGPDGTTREDRARLAGDTLIWERAGITYRLESELSFIAALEVARSVP